jgi:hypothetical protein
MFGSRKMLIVVFQYKRIPIVKRRTFIYLPAFLSLLLVASAYAHDPAEHAKEGSQPDCSSMKEMDPAKMDMKDPVTQAMMQKCMKDMHVESGSKGGSAATYQHEEAADNATQPKTEHQHRE